MASKMLSARWYPLQLHDELHGHYGFTWPVCVASIIFVTLVLIVRVWARLLNRNQRFGGDDWTAVAAWPFMVAQELLIMLSIQSGLGVHIEQLSVDQLELTNRLLIALIILYYFNIILIRTSISLYYIRIFGTSRRFRMAVWLNIGLNVLWGISIIIAAVYQCRDPRGLWDLKVLAQTTCDSLDIHQYYCASSSVVLDLLSLLLPLPMISKLQLKQSKKRELYAIFFISYVVPILTIGRLIVTGIVGQKLNTDPEWYFLDIILWVPFETTFGYLGICMPAVLFLTRRWQSTGFVSLFSRRAFASRAAWRLEDAGAPNSSSAHSESGMLPKKMRDSFDPSATVSETKITLDEDGQRPAKGILQTREYSVNQYEWSKN